MLMKPPTIPAPLARSATADLTFAAFRAANVARCLMWHPGGIQSWSSSDWLTAVTGELGELASLLKMRNRERDGLPGNKFSPTDKMVADEIADVFTYLDLLAAALGVDLANAAASKFNEISERVGLPHRIPRTPIAIGVDAASAPKFGAVHVDGALVCCSEFDHEPCPHEPARRCAGCPGGSTRPATPSADDATREAFEAWLQTGPGFLRRWLNRRDFPGAERRGEYTDAAVEWQWRAWCAAKGGAA